MCAGSAVRRLRPVLAAALLALPLLAVLAPEAVAQATHTLSIAVSPTSGAEGNSGRTFKTVTVSLSQAYSQKVCVDVGISGDATKGNDFELVTLGSDTVIPAWVARRTFSIDTGETSFQFRIRVIGDTVAESDETVILSLHDPRISASCIINSSDIAISPTAGSATYTVTDDDTTPTGSLTFSPTSVTVVEGETASYTVRLGTAPTGTVTVTPSSDNGDVTFAPASLTFTTGNWNSPKTVTVSAAMDVDGTDDTATISHSASGGGYGSVTGNVGVTVTDNDVARLLFSTTSLLVTEGGSTAYTVRLGMLPTGTVTVTPSSNNGDVTFAPATLNFTTGNWSSPQTVTVSASEDSDQNNEMATLSHAASGGGYGSVTGNVQVAVNDNDVLPPCTNCVWITGGSDITEGGTANFTVHANPAPTANLTVPLWVYDARGHSDFLYGKYEGSEKLTIRSGTTAAMFTVPTYDDVKDEADGDVRVQISSGRAGGKTFWRHGPNDTASVTVRDDDASITTHDPPDVYASVSGSAVTATKTVPNNTTGEQVCFGIAGGAYPAVHVNRFKVNYRMRAGTREFWRSYVWLGRDTPFGTRACLELRTLTARCGNPATYTFELLEGGQSVTRDRVTRHDVTLDHYDISTSNPTAAFTVTGDTCPMRSEQVLPGGTPSEVTVSADRTSVTEGGDVTFTVTADPAPAHDLAVDVTATEEMGAGADQKAVAHLQTVTVLAGTTSATWTLTTMSDDDALADGTVEFRAFADQNGLYTLGTPSEVTVTLLDDDGVTTQSVPDSVVTDPVTPAVDPALVALVRGYAAETWKHPDHVKRWKQVLAAFGDDNGYTAMTAAEAQTYADRGWQRWVPVVAALEALEAAQQPLTLPAVSVSAGADVTEGGDAVFTVTANPAPAAELSVTVTVATAGEFGVTAGSRTVPIPVTGSATLTLATANDGADEPDGSVSVTVAAGNGYTVGDPASGSVSIADNDLPLPAVTVSAGDAVTEGGDAAFTVTASPAPASSLAVSVTVAAEGDYGIASGTQTVSIPVTGSATLTLATANDDADEPDGSVTLTVAAGDGYTVGAPATGSVSIADDDLPPPAVSIAAKAASVTEGGSAVFTLTADRAPDADLTVTLSVAETGGGDHVAVADEGPATAVIAKGATEAVFSVATVDDDVDEPDGSVTVTLKDGGGYTVPSPPGNAAAVTVSDNDAAALPSLSVADVTVKEGAWMEFTVRLSAPSAGGVSVKVSTRDSTPVSATTRDYWPISGRTVSFRAGETERSVGVIVFDDSHDEEPETFEVVLSDARGAAIADGVAVGTITNDDPMPAAWLARFGRAVAEQALDGIAARMTADRTPGLRGTIAGQALDFGGNAAGGPDLSQSPGLLFGSGVEAQSRGMTMQEVLRGSSFSLTGEADGSGGTLSFWGGSPGSGGLVSGSRFAGRDASVRLDGEASAALLGTDYARGRWLVGFALSQVRAEGGYASEGGSDCSGLPESVPASACAVAVQAGDGEVEASLTATIPYAALAVSERLRLWGAAGQGAGDVTVKTGPGGSYRADTAWSMAAAGLRGDLLAPPAPGPGSGAGSGTGPALALTSDALWVRTSSEKTGDLAASESDVSRLRVGLEGSWGVALSGGGSVTPKLELGARHDGGDAETGFGVELGGGLAWRDPKLGLTLDLSGRTLVAHDDGGLEDRGVSARLSYDPEPSSGRGLSLSLGQDWGGRSAGGLDALFQPEPLEDRAGSGGGHEATSRWGMEAAWGLPVLGGRFTGSPYMGLGLATGARDYSLGWRLAPEAATAPGLSFGLRATRRESDTAPAEHTVGVELSASW